MFYSKITFVTALVVLGFFICWAPFHAQRLITVYLSNSEVVEYFNNWMFFITGICYYFSSTLNPILYNVMSEKMRNAFKEIFCGTKTKKTSKRETLRETSNTYISIPSNQNEDLFLTKDNESRLLGEGSQTSSKKYNSTSKSSSVRSKVLGETGV